MNIGTLFHQGTVVLFKSEFDADVIKTKKVFQYKGSPQDMFCKKGVLRNFAKFTGKHLCQSLYKFVATVVNEKHKRMPSKVIQYRGYKKFDYAICNNNLLKQTEKLNFTKLDCIYPEIA